jgi:hypothetical protein
MDKAQYTEPLIQQAKTEIQKRVDSLKEQIDTRLKRIEGYKQDMREARRPEDKRRLDEYIDRAEDDISVYNAELNEYQKGIGLSAVDLIKQHFSGFLQKKAQYEADYREARNRQQADFRAMKDKPEFKEDLAKLGLAGKSYVSLSDYEGAVKKFNQNVAYEKNLVNWATKAGFDKLPASIQQTMKDRGLVTFDEQKFSTGGKTLVTEPMQTGSLILTASEASKLKTIPSYATVLPDMTADQLARQSIDTRSPYIVTKPTGGLGTEFYFREPTPTQPLMGPVSLGGEIPEGVVPQWYEGKITPRMDAGGLTFNVPGYEPIRMEKEYVASDTKFRPILTPLKGELSRAGGFVSTSFQETFVPPAKWTMSTVSRGLSMADEAIQETPILFMGGPKVKDIAPWIVEQTKPGTAFSQRFPSVGGETGLTRERYLSNIGESIDWITTGLTQKAPRPIQRFATGYTEYITKPAFQFASGRAMDFLQRPVTEGAKIYAQIKTGQIVMSALGLAGAGLSVVPKVGGFLGGTFKAGQIGAGLYFGGKMATSLGGEYLGAETSLQRANIIKERVEPLVWFGVGAKQGVKDVQRWITPNVRYETFGLRDYRKTYRYDPKIKATVTQYGRRAIVEPSPIQRFFGRADPTYKGIYFKDPIGYEKALRVLKATGLSETSARQQIALINPRFKPSTSVTMGKPVSVSLDSLGKVLGTTRAKGIELGQRVDMGGKYLTVVKDVKQVYRPNPFRPKVKVEKGDLIFGSKQVQPPAPPRPRMTGREYLSTKRVTDPNKVGQPIITESEGIFVAKPKLRFIKGQRVLSRDVKLIKARGEFDIRLPDDKRGILDQPKIEMKDLTIKGNVRAESTDFGRIGAKQSYKKVFEYKGPDGKIEAVVKGAPKSFISKTRLPTKSESLTSVDIKVLDTKTKPGTIKVGQIGTGKEKVVLFKPVEVVEARSFVRMRTSTSPQTIKVKGYVSPSGRKVRPYARQYKGLSETKDVGIMKDKTFSFEKLPDGDGITILRPAGKKSPSFIQKQLQQPIKEIITEQIAKSSVQAVKTVGKSSPVVTPIKVTAPTPIRGDSIYAGTGMYEQTVGGRMFMIQTPKVISLMTPSVKTKDLSIVKVKSQQILTQTKPIKISQIEKGLQVQKLQTQKLQMQKLQIQKLQIQKLQLTPLNLQKIQTQKLQVQKMQMQKLQVQKLQTQKLQMQKIALALSPLSLAKTRTKKRLIPLRPRPKPVVPPIPELSFESQERLRKRRQKDLDKAFTVEVRRKGKFLETGVALSKEEAIAFGIKKTLGGAEATFRLKETKQPRRSLGLGLPGRFLDLFRPSKSKRETPLTFVQRKTKRILTPGEKREISQLGGRPRKSVRRSR